jgi:DNA invertase Pin-like site-specific DNA recombinase
MSKVRCAIYTRKSSDEGLELEFNSLDAQFEACKAYIASQRHEGWSLTRERYDDGGFSGGNMERPALARLLADAAAGKIDVIVIYKIDRLTRSLADFARIIEVLEKASASFVSVTQSFNTSTSMGRLMLHVLLSFAQFEREVGAERVRDKIAASKAKGMWMGGTVPLGFDVRDKKLVVNVDEAETVRSIFAKFIELRSVTATLEWTREQGLRTKQRLKLGREVGDNPFQYGALRGVLANRLYVGEVAYKGKIYPGQQERIVDRENFEEAQTLLSTLSTEEIRGPKLVSESLLQGLIVDRNGRRMGPVHTSRKGQRFRYYVTHPKSMETGGPAAYRLPAEQLEQICCQMLAEHLQSQVSSIDDQQDALTAGAALTSKPTSERRQLLRRFVKQVSVGDAELTIAMLSGEEIIRMIDRVRHGNDARLVIAEQRDGNDARLVIAEQRDQKEHRSDRQLLVLLQDAHRAQALALNKPKVSLQQLAAKFGRSTERYKRLLRLSYLSPLIIAAILDGQQPSRVTNRFLQNLDGLPHAWAEQEQMLLR